MTKEKKVDSPFDALFNDHFAAYVTCNPRFYASPKVSERRRHADLRPVTGFLGRNSQRNEK